MVRLKLDLAGKPGQYGILLRVPHCMLRCALACSRCQLQLRWFLVESSRPPYYVIDAPACFGWQHAYTTCFILTSPSQSTPILPLKLFLHWLCRWQRLASVHPDRVAMREPHRAGATDLTYAELNEVISSAGAGFSAVGLEKGDKVGRAGRSQPVLPNRLLKRTLQSCRCRPLHLFIQACRHTV